MLQRTHGQQDQTPQPDTPAQEAGSTVETPKWGSEIRTQLEQHASAGLQNGGSQQCLPDQCKLLRLQAQRVRPRAAAALGVLAGMGVLLGAQRAPKTELLWLFYGSDGIKCSYCMVSGRRAPHRPSAASHARCVCGALPKRGAPPRAPALSYS